MTAAVFVAVTVAVAGLLCGHQGQPWPLRRQKPPQPTEPTAGRTRAPNRSTNFLCTRKDPS